MPITPASEHQLLNQAMNPPSPLRQIGKALGLVLLTLRVATHADAAPTIVSVVPATGATGVSTNATVTFTFSEAMNPSSTGATFIDDPFQIIPTAQYWSAGNTVLTCLPGAPWPFAHTITWVMTGSALSGTTSGSFTTGIPINTTPLVLTNYAGSGGGFVFDVTCDPGQSLVAEYRTNLSTGLWQTLAATNASTVRVHFTHPNAMTNRNCFYRVRVGT
jgi:hypothetical protein